MYRNKNQNLSTAFSKTKNSVFGQIPSMFKSSQLTSSDLEE